MVLVFSCKGSGEGVSVFHAWDQDSQPASPELTAGLERETRLPSNHVSLPQLPPAHKTKGECCGMSSASSFPASLGDDSYLRGSFSRSVVSLVAVRDTGR